MEWAPRDPKKSSIGGTPTDERGGRCSTAAMTGSVREAIKGGGGYGYSGGDKYPREKKYRRYRKGDKKESTGSITVEHKKGHVNNP